MQGPRMGGPQTNRVGLIGNGLRMRSPYGRPELADEYGNTPYNRDVGVPAKFNWQSLIRLTAPRSAVTSAP